MTTSALFAAAMRRKKTTPNTYTVSSSAIPNRTLSLLDLILLGTGGTLGSGLFLLTGRAARQIAGPAISVSFGLAAVACLFSALSYAEMSSRLPNSGGAYAFSYTALGELPAFLVGMCLTLEYGISSAAVARSWASYLGDTVTVFPSWMTGIGSQFCVLATCLIFTIAFLLSAGMQQAKWVINIGTLLYATVVVIIIAFGSQKVDTDNWTPFFPFGVQGAVSGASAVFFSYIGFDEVATVSEEAHNAARNVPIAIIISLFLVSAMYVSASLILTGTVNYTVIDIDAPFSTAMRTINLPFIAKLVGIGTALGMMNTALVAFAAQPRIFISMGRDGLLPRALAFSTRGTTMGCGFVVALLALFVDTQALADVVSGGTLVAFLSANVSLLLTRCRIHSRDHRVPTLVYGFVACCAFASVLVRLAGASILPLWAALAMGLPLCIITALLLLAEDFEGGDSCERAPPTFLCPLVPVMPMAGSATIVFLLVQLSVKALTALCVWLVLSGVAYFCYGAKNAIIANEYRTVHGSPAHSFNSFEELAMEANSLSEGSEKEVPVANDVFDDVVPEEIEDKNRETEVSATAASVATVMATEEHGKGDVIVNR